MKKKQEIIEFINALIMLVIVGYLSMILDARDLIRKLKSFVQPRNAF